MGSLLGAGMTDGHPHESADAQDEQDDEKHVRTVSTATERASARSSAS